MKLYAWNVNSVRARKERLLDFLDATSPDVLCLQELKCLDEEFPAEEVAAKGYRFSLHGQKTYNGVAILSKAPQSDVVRGLQDGVEDPQCRVIAATVSGVRVVSVYVPNGQTTESPAYAYKLEWYKRLKRYLEGRHKPSEPLVVTGDFNVAPEPRDVHDPAAWEGQVLFSEPERAALKDLCGYGLVDTFRIHSQEAGKYSWWDYRMLGFPKNRGLRIDFVFATEGLAKKCTAAGIDREMRKGKTPSDHAPVWADFAL